MGLSAWFGATTPIGLVEGRLRECPSSPNCVCSQTQSPSQAIEPLGFSGSADEAIKRLKAIVLNLPRTRLVGESQVYLHFECRSAVFRFVDDLEFLLDAERNVIHCRSASRVGYSDLGVNRKRVEQIRQRFTKTR